MIFFACSVCFGDPASPLSKGAWAGMFFLLGVVGLVLSAVAYTGFVWSRRERKLNVILSPAAGGTKNQPVDPSAL